MFEIAACPIRSPLALLFAAMCVYLLAAGWDSIISPPGWLYYNGHLLACCHHGLAIGSLVFQLQCSKLVAWTWPKQVFH